MVSSLEMWSFELMVLLSGLLPNPKLETSVLSIWLVSYLRCFLHLLQMIVLIFVIFSIITQYLTLFFHILGFVSLNTTAAAWMIPFGLSGAGRLVFLLKFKWPHHLSYASLKVSLALPILNCMVLAAFVSQMNLELVVRGMHV